jgi:peptidoglycan/xylan/chitin deacetylase (PgdA/CDA1 family)
MTKKYCLPIHAFRAQVEQAVRSKRISRHTSDQDIFEDNVVFTFDDGYASFMDAAEVLEMYGYRGVFFIVTSRIGMPGYLSQDKIKALRKRGHIIGSHSVNHQARNIISNEAASRYEWSGSKKILEQILGEEICLAAIPGGFYSNKLFSMIAQCGYQGIFTLEPVIKDPQVDGCRLYERYLATDHATVMRLLQGRRITFSAYAAVWHIKSILKNRLPALYHGVLRKS